MSDQKSMSLDEIAIEFVKKGLLLAIVGYFFAKILVEKDGFILKKLSKTRRFLFLIASIIVSVVYLSIVFPLVGDKVHLQLLAAILPSALVSFAASFLFAENLFEKQLRFKLSPQHFKGKKPSMARLEGMLTDQRNAPIGMSVTLGKPISIESSKRNQHIMITGATGLGKTTMAINLIRHDFLWNRPVIVVDPKGDKEDIEICRKYAEIYEREEQFRLFSCSNSEGGSFYNVLKIGDPLSKADKAIYAFGLEHHHYRNVALNFLALIFEIHEVLDREISLTILEDIVLSKEKLISLFEEILERPEDPVIKKIKLKIGRFKKIKDDEISGLQSAISRLNSSQFRNRLNPSENAQEIDLVDTIQSNKIAYFDLNASEYREISETLGRFLLKDLEIISGKMQKKEVSLSCDYAGVYIDEFDTFANEDFNKFLKVARSARLGLTLMFQSVAGLDEISPNLEHQMATNTLISLHFRVNSSPDIDFISMLPGTQKNYQTSSQIDRNSAIVSETGMGTEVQTEEFKLNPNLIRNLPFGNCIVINKSNGTYDAAYIWSSKSEVAAAKKRSELFGTLSNLVDKAAPNCRVRNISYEHQSHLMLMPTDRISMNSYKKSSEYRSKNLELGLN